MPFNLLLPVLLNFLLTNSSVSNFRITQFLLKREGFVFSATKDQQMYTSLPDRSISTGTFISNSFQFYLLMYLCVHLFSATQRSFHALQPQRFISLLFFCFLFVFCFVLFCFVSFCFCCFFLAREEQETEPRLPRHTGLFPTQSSLSRLFFSCQRR